VGATGVLITTGLTEPDALDKATGEAVPDRVVHSLQELFALPELAGT
jgi:ribonucleotide monophosphatase NagD (HAD superfamily)